jgi:hypothetical protein
VPPALGAMLLFVVVFSALFAPVLLGRATFVHGDALSVSLPLQQVLASALAEGRIPLWSDAIYGGHPLFAEGQGGFAHPLNLLLFGTLPRLFDAPSPGVGAGTLYAHGLLHLICGLLAASGTFGLCRALGLGVSASLFAGLALATSQDWLGLSGNSAIALATAFAPFALWAAERWWRRPDLCGSLGLALSLCAMLLAGYPQAVHAVGIFVAVLLLVRADRAFWHSPWRHLATGCLALVAASGLSAIQLLPTFELVSESVRAGGVDLVQSGTPLLQLKGLLFSIGQRAAVEPGLGSLFVLALSGMGVRAARVPLAWVLATFVLFQLGLADQSPLYRALQGVLPGLDSFRIAHLYSTIGLIGVAVLAGFGFQRIADAGRPSRSLLVQASGVAAILAGLCLVTHDDAVRPVGYLFPIVAVGITAAWTLRGETRLLPACWIALLLVEIAVLRSPLHDFVDLDAVREPPPTVAFLQEQQPDRRDLRVANVPHFFSYIGFASASTPDLARLAGLFLSSMDAGSNLLWGIPSMNANLALELVRRAAVSELIVSEVRGESGGAPGRRFIDAISVGYVVAHNQHRSQPYSAELREVFYDEDFRFFVLENPYARNRLQLFSARETRWVPDVDAAIAALAGGAEAAGAVLEGSGSAAARELAPGPAEDDGPSGAAIVTSNISAERYTVIVDANEPVHLLVADAPYPGWKARLDGEPVPVLAANVLGKAVAVPAGTHRVELYFAPDSFRWGAWISAATLVAGLALVGWQIRITRRCSRA